DRLRRRVAPPHRAVEACGRTPFARGKAARHRFARGDRDEPDAEFARRAASPWSSAVERGRLVVGGRGGAGGLGLGSLSGLGPHGTRSDRGKTIIGSPRTSRTPPSRDAEWRPTRRVVVKPEARQRASWPGKRGRCSANGNDGIRGK